MANTAGVVGRVQATGATVSVTDVIVAAAINGDSATALGTNCNVIVGTKDKGTDNVTNCATTIVNDDYTVVPNHAKAISCMVSRDENGYISEVNKDNVKKLLEDNPEFAAEIENKVREMSAGGSILNEEDFELDEGDEDDFDPPVCWAKMQTKSRVRYKILNENTIKLGYVGIWLTFTK